MPLGYEQLKEDFAAAQAEKDQAEAEQAASAPEPKADDAAQEDGTS